jgi:hypothetical protein
MKALHAPGTLAGSSFPQPADPTGFAIFCRKDAEVTSLVETVHPSD